jgi:hypothetical protein
MKVRTNYKKKQNGRAYFSENKKLAGPTPPTKTNIATPITLVKKSLG